MYHQLKRSMVTQQQQQNIGSLEIHQADMKQSGAYQCIDVIQGYYAVCHVAGNVGTYPRWQPQQPLC